jgi:hypothetical protein
VSELGRVKAPAELVSTLVASGRYVSAAERDELERSPFYVTAVKPRFDTGSQFGDSCLFVVAAPGLLEGRALLSLPWNRERERWARALELELRGSDAIGPYLLALKETRSGQHAYALIPACDTDAGSSPDAD